MRIASLDLIRYGRFADRVLEFPKRDCDFHLVVGRNEAGKTTIRSAISELLFGFENNSPYGYRFENPQLRIGAALEQGDARLYLRRRKGRTNTLLDRNEKPLAETVLETFLNQKNREFFERLFSLDQQGLVKGGQDVVQARNDLGRMLFQSAAGLAGLGEALKRLEEEADQLWGSRAAEKRAYTKAERRLSQADRDLKEATLRAPEYRDAVKKRDEALAAAKGNDENAANLRSEEHKLRRIQQTLPRLAERTALLERNAAMGPVIALPDDAGERLANTRSRLAAADEGIRLVEATSTSKKEELASLAVDEVLLSQASEIERLRDLHAQYRPYPADITKRHVEIQFHRAVAERHTNELGWPLGTDEEIAARLPNRLPRAKVHALAQQYGGIAAAVTSAKEALEKQRTANRDAEAELACIPDSPPSAALMAALGSARRLGDVRKRYAELSRSAERTQTELTSALAALRPWTGTAETLDGLQVPGAALLTGLKTRIEASEAICRRAAERRTDRTGALEAARLRIEQIQRDERPVAAEELHEARSRRDRLWTSIQEGLETGDLDASRGQVEPFEASMAQTDQLADRRFDRAAQSANLTRSLQEVERLQLELTAAKEKEEVLFQERAAVLAELTRARKTLGLPATTLAEIEEWLRARTTALAKVASQREAAATVEAFEAELDKAIDALRQAIGDTVGSLGSNGLEGFAALLQQAELLLAQRQENVQKRAVLQQQLSRGQREATDLETRFELSLAELNAWREAWGAACRHVSLDEGLLPEQAMTALELIRGLEESIGTITNIRTNRIDAMNRDLASFAIEVGKLTTAVAPDLLDRPPAEAVDLLAMRLTEVRRAAVRRDAIEKELQKDEAKLQVMTNSRNAALEALRPMFEQTGVEDVEALARAVDRATAHRRLADEVARIERDLLEAGNGLSLIELAEEVRSQDRDRLGARLTEIEAALRDLGAERQLIGGDLQEANAKLSQMQGTDTASLAAEARQQALADMGDAVQRWTRVTVGMGLLRAAMERYREAKQAPILKRAEKLFGTLTLGEFKALRIDYGRADQPVLLAIRNNDDEDVPLEGLSTGTADQLFLALRIAALDDYLGAGHPMPFIVDDLFVNFDDDRAAAGIEVLSKVAYKTQVVFLTHHAHLIDIAKKTLSEGSAPMFL